MPNFTILGQDDQFRLIKQLLEAENIDDKKSPARLVLAVISRWKDRGLVPHDVRGMKPAAHWPAANWRRFTRSIRSALPH